MPTEVFTQVHVENIQLRAKDREAGMKLYWVDQERADLARKLKEAQGETSDATGFRKRSHAEMEEELSKTSKSARSFRHLRIATGRRFKTWRNNSKTKMLSLRRK